VLSALADGSAMTAGRVDRGALTRTAARLLRARPCPRGAQVAAVATARKLVSLLWCLLTREQDYAYGQPSLTRHKIRTLELAAGAQAAQRPAAHRPTRRPSH